MIPDATERQIHLVVADYLTKTEKLDGFMWFHTPNGGHRTQANGGLLKAMGMKAGIPDICIIKGGKSHWIEIKTRTGRASPVQSEMSKQLIEAGCVYAICRSLDEVVVALRGWGITK